VNHYYCDENCLSVYVPYCGDGNLDVGEVNAIRRTPRR